MRASDAKQSNSNQTCRFIDCIQKDQEKLSITSKLLRTIFDAYDISPRFAGFISRQHMPGSATEFDKSTFEPSSHGRSVSSLVFVYLTDAELWYSAVIRSNWLHGDETARDLSRKVADWRRFSLWSKHNLSSKRSNVVVMGCPPQMRQNFASLFLGENGLQLQRHPMLIHAYFARNLLLRTYDFLQEFSDHLYDWVSRSLPGVLRQHGEEHNTTKLISGT